MAKKTTQGAIDYLDQVIAESYRPVSARLMDLLVASSVLGISATVSLCNNVPTVAFYSYSGPAEENIDTTLTYNSQVWEIELFEQTIKEMLDELDAKLEQEKVAVAAWSTKLTAEEQTAIKANITKMK